MKTGLQSALPRGGTIICRLATRYPAVSQDGSSQFGPYLDSMNQKFTGQSRDTETLNDFFNARYYTAPLMRFLSPDPGNAGADPTDQTWNAYAYVRNNPLALVDPSGMDFDLPDLEGDIG